MEEEPEPAERVTPEASHVRVDGTRKGSVVRVDDKNRISPSVALVVTERGEKIGARPSSPPIQHVHNLPPCVTSRPADMAKGRYFTAYSETD